ncbi:unnamed protein product [Prunus armeniaca]
MAGGTFADAFEAVASMMSKADLERFACCAWTAWKLRNDFLHGKQITRVDNMVENTMEMLEVFKSCEERSKLPLVSPQVRWLKPRVNTLLLNCDGAMGREQGGRGLGGCCRDHDGNFICGFASFGPPGLDVLGTELVAVREGLLMMGYMGFTRFTIGLDSQEAVSILKDGLDWWSNIGNVVEDVRRLMVDREVVGVFYQHRKGNGVAHSLAEHGLRVRSRLFWKDRAPPWLSILLDKDIAMV